MCNRFKFDGDAQGKQFEIVLDTYELILKLPYLSKRYAYGQEMVARSAIVTTRRIFKT